MILRDQPRCFPATVLAAVSSRDDGTMLDRTLGDRHDPQVVANRHAFVTNAGGDYNSSVYQIISYGDTFTYDTIAVVNDPNIREIQADALYTERRGIGIFLPVADCVATILYDPVREVLAVAHLGRHASVARLMAKLISFMRGKGSSPEDLVVWMAPSVGRASYRMAYFDHTEEPAWQAFTDHAEDGIYVDLAGFNAQLAQDAGVLASNIHRSMVDTALDPQYYSHSQGDTTGRFAVFAQLR